MTLYCPALRSGTAASECSEVRTGRERAKTDGPIGLDPSMQGIKQAAEAESTCSLGQDSLVRKPGRPHVYKVTETASASQIDPAGYPKGRSS